MGIVHDGFKEEQEGTKIVSEDTFYMWAYDTSYDFIFYLYRSVAFCIPMYSVHWVHVQNFNE